MPYFAEQIEETLTGVDLIVMAATRPPVSFFAYPGKKSWLTPEGCDLLQLATVQQDAPAALAALADELGAPAEPALRAKAERPGLPSGKLAPDTAGQAIGALLPPEAILMDEGATSSLGSYIFTAGADPFDQLQLTGGAIGMGLPAATGAAVACPDRKVVCLEGDGSAMYTIQSLWTQARENLDVTTVIFSNRSYAILNIELARVGAQNPGPKALSMLDLHNPDLNFADMARGMGVDGSRATTAEEFNDQFADAMKRRGPRLIEVCF
jgi:acetolactate synthase-1/2/3 large subunit